MSNGKVEGFLHTVENLGGGDSPGQKVAVATARGLAHLLHADVVTEGVFDGADEVAHLRELKAMVKQALEAINEQLEIREEILHDAMVEEELPNFSRRGQSYYLTTERYVTAINGTADPALIAWFAEHDREDLAKTSINAQSLRSAVKEIIEENDGECPADLAALIRLTEKPTVGVRKAAR